MTQVVNLNHPFTILAQRLGVQRKDVPARQLQPHDACGILVGVRNPHPDFGYKIMQGGNVSLIAGAEYSGMQVSEIYGRYERFSACFGLKFALQRGEGEKREGMQISKQSTQNL